MIALDLTFPPGALDLWTGIMCLLMGGALFELFILSAKDRGQWLPLPFYVRAGLITSAIGMMYRAVDLINLSKPTDASNLGHIDLVGFMLTGSMTFTFVGLVVYAIRNSYSRRVRAEFEALKDVAKGPNGEALAMMAFERSHLEAPLAALDELKAQGIRVIHPMGELKPPG